jgi:hypothetical protein
LSTGVAVLGKAIAARAELDVSRHLHRSYSLALRVTSLAVRITSIVDDDTMTLLPVRIG